MLVNIFIKCHDNILFGLQAQKVMVTYLKLYNVSEIIILVFNQIVPKILQLPSVKVLT